MALLQQLHIHNFRNIVHASLSLSPRVNLIFGDNGSGKTSILESIHLLSRARSFRSHMMRHVIRAGEVSTTVHGKLLGSQGVTQTVGVMRDRQGGFEFRLDYQSYNSAAVLARALPLQVFNAASFDLIEGAPQFRRQFVDWGVFHVKHEYAELWRHFQRALKQRNSLLRHGKMGGGELDSWDEEVARLAIRVNELRDAYLQDLLPRVEALAADFIELQGPLQFEFHPGWDVHKDLRDLFHKARDRELSQGQTLYGPHRADLKIRYLGLPAAQSLSRGQTKALVYAMKVGQGLAYQAVSGQPCLFLLDDFPAELDEGHRQKIVDLLLEQEAQLVVTGTHKNDLLHLDWRSDAVEAAMFHVKHGEVTEHNPSKDVYQ